MRFRHLLILTAAIAAADLSAEALAKEGDLEIVRVFTGWRDGASFKRIAEYFDGKEYTGRDIVLRTHPEQRTGYYFLVRLKNPGAARAAQFKLHLVEQGSPAPRTTVLAAELKPGTQVFQLGLTGPEWQDATAQPVAWHIEVLAADDGRLLASEKSYLWEKPATK